MIFFSDDEHKNLDIFGIDDEVFTFVEDTVEWDDYAKDDEEEDPAPGVSAGIARIASAEDILTDQACIAYESALTKLAYLQMPYVCRVKGCKMPYNISTQMIGTSLYLIWVGLIYYMMHFLTINNKVFALGECMMFDSRLGAVY